VVSLEDLNKKMTNLEKRVSKLENPSNKRQNIHVEDTKVIEELLNGKFFDKPKNFREIIKKLKVDATYEKNSDYKKALTLLVRNKKLARKQVSHQWGYSKNE